MTLPPIPDPPGWVRSLLRFGDWLLGRTAMNRCGHHWHFNLPPGGGDLAAGAFYTCCACPAQQHGRMPKDPGARPCTRYTP